MLDKENCGEKTDEELVALTLKNQDFFSCIVERYEAKLTRYIRRISAATQEDAEDLLQEIFVKVYRNLYGFDPSLKFSSWIYRIAHNQVISQWRKTKSRPQVLKFEADEDFLKFIAADEDLAGNIERKFTGEEVRDVISRLDGKYKEVLVLKFLEEKDYKEISDILRKPLGTVATLINRAKKQFAKVVKEKEIKF
ncbi:MAG: RNA polymerase sigma factor SigW [Candidatus Moranbacteria bacterium CG_4_10_14_3_um_filter_44_15]|nr:MAG: RNA polymerase sigma factor SigW [Candidatus Moranbacteria bacterium CG17_big_fil_post_rev_8_21_14_2_50_44_12]PIW93610.1 MAG: RNA polymerase sigma factor SigW [Candidatus Moranbacteria bacterium CG_4_8_14_3_um_filter_43_15]PIX91156.1 MAG: RNA polymerase sigma factor SigW [Candidatus Moranbacteria bacterium CG_4_10_14_3_um_filter_44_15]PJA86277.1 MAG: RNA polymerase sigma factor SigW [Candidatus Moranbacteria bacterium CG_4_9_14_3_um_filter_44_28]